MKKSKVGTLPCQLGRCAGEDLQKDTAMLGRMGSERGKGGECVPPRDDGK